MYIVQEKGKIIFADENLQNLENTLKCMPDNEKMNIEEVSESSITEAYDGCFYLIGYAPIKPEPTKEEQQQARQEAYKNEVDPLMSEYNRKKTFNLFEEGEEEALLAEIEAKVAEIKARYPYPID